MVGTAWIGELRKGVMEMCVLHLLSAQPCYGYEIAQKLADRQSLAIKESTLYLILARLEREALVTVTKRVSERGPKRRYFELNAEGRARLAAMRHYWGEMSSDIAELLEREGNTNGKR